MENEKKEIEEKKGVMWMIPLSLYEKLLKKSKEQRRSVTQQAVFLIEKGFECTQDL